MDTPNEGNNDYRRRLLSESEKLTPEELTRREDLVGWIYKLVPRLEGESHNQWVDRAIEFLNGLEN